MRRHVIGCALVLGWLGVLVAFRDAVVEPRAWAAACANVAPPWACLPRSGLLWLQYQGGWGAAALALGAWAWAGGPFAVQVAAVAVGAAAVIDYNASFGMLGAALGAWAWIMPGAAAVAAAGAWPAAARSRSTATPRG